jgi:hypothetical protein
LEERLANLVADAPTPVAPIIKRDGKDKAVITITVKT